MAIEQDSGYPVDKTLRDAIAALNTKVDNIISGSAPAFSREKGSTILYDGTITATTTAAPLGSQACNGVLIQSDLDNTVDILIGNATSQHIRILPGADFPVSCSNINLIYIKSVSGTAVINYLAFS